MGEEKENKTKQIEKKSLNTAGLPNQNKKDDRRDGERPHPETTDSGRGQARRPKS
jgi:hypothetical protein